MNVFSTFKLLLKNPELLIEPLKTCGTRTDKNNLVEILKYVIKNS